MIQIEKLALPLLLFNIHRRFLMSSRFKYLIRKRQIGDVLWIEPVIRQLSVKYSKVIVHTKYNELFNNYPCANVIFKNKLSFIEKVLARIEFILNTSFLFINLDMAYERSPNEHFLHAYQRKAALQLTLEYPRLYLNVEEQSKKIIPFNRYVILHLDSFSDRNYRRVYGVDWEVIISHLNNRGFEVVKVEKSQITYGETKTNTTIRDLIMVINKSSFFVGIDSAPSHIAASLGIPSIVFFGSVNPMFRHFAKLFKGFFLQQHCEFAGCYHSAIGKTGAICRLVGNEGIPKCSLHTTEYVIQNIEALIKQYIDND